MQARKRPRTKGLLQTLLESAVVSHVRRCSYTERVLAVREANPPFHKPIQSVSIQLIQRFGCIVDILKLESTLLEEASLDD